MNDQLEQDLREALSRRTAQLDSDPMVRLAAIDYHPRRHRIGKLPAIGALSASGIAAGVATVVALGSSAAPAFAGWQPTPSTPTPGQLAQAAQVCGQGLGNPLLTDARGPFTASIYANSTTNDLCIDGNGVSMSTRTTSAAPDSVAAGQIELGETSRDMAGNGLTLVDGRVGAGVTAVTIDRNDGSSVDATVANGWYIAWWPGTVTAKDAQVTTAAGSNTVSFPAAPSSMTNKPCPTGAYCASGFSSGGSANTTSPGKSSVTVQSSSVNGSNTAQ
jgi:hypothetical protein